MDSYDLKDFPLRDIKKLSEKMELKQINMDSYDLKDFPLQDMKNLSEMIRFKCKLT